MSDLVMGKNVTVSMLISGSYLPLFCAKSMEFNYTQTAIESTTITSGLDREYEVGIGTATLNLTGITKTTDVNKIGPFYLFQQSVRRAKNSYLITFSAQDASVKTLAFTAIMIRNNFNSNVQSWAQCAIDWQISGAVNIGESIPTPGGGGASGGGSSGTGFTAMLSDFWLTVNGNNFIDGASTGEWDGTSYTLVSTDDIIVVFVEGTQYNIVTGTPTPGQRECELNLSSGQILFPTDLVFDGSQTVCVVWER